MKKTILLGAGNKFSNVVRSIYGSRVQRTAGAKATTTKSYRCDKSTGRYSSRCTYTKVDHYAMIESWCVISPVGYQMEYSIHTDDGILSGIFRAPAGYHIRYDDEMGAPCLTGSTGELHLTTDDVLVGGRAAAKKLRENAARRTATARVEKIAAETLAATDRALSDVRVTPQDAALAGNCDAGIRNFALKIRADLRDPYLSVPYAVLAGAANETERERVRLCGLTALARETMVCI